MMPISRHPSPSAATWVALSQVRRDAVGEVVGGAPREVDAVGQDVESPSPSFSAFLPVATEEPPEQERTAEESDFPIYDLE